MSSVFGQVLEDFVDKGEEGECGFVDVEPFVLEVVHDVLLERAVPKEVSSGGSIWLRRSLWMAEKKTEPMSRVEGLSRRRDMAKGYLPYDVDQRLLLPPDMRAWLPEGHLSRFLLDVVSELDLSASTRVYEAKDTRGRAGYHPVMRVALLVYA